MTEIRDAAFEDLADIARIHVRAWQQAYAGQLDQSYLDSLDIAARQRKWERAFNENAAGNPDTCIALSGGVPAGFVSFGLARDAGMTGRGEIHAIYLLQEYCGRSIGRALFTAAREKLSSRGLDPVYLWVLDTNVKAIRAYERWGGQVDKSIVKDRMIGSQPVKEVAVFF